MAQLTDKQLVELAAAAAEKAYAPYSGCCVGAALLCGDGTVFTGSNIENASFGATVCAERTALFTAVHSGKRDFVRLAVAGSKEGKPYTFYPCGICRQTLCEFCPDDMPVLIATADGYERTTLCKLMPSSFSLGEK